MVVEMDSCKEMNRQEEKAFVCGEVVEKMRFTFLFSRWTAPQDSPRKVPARKETEERKYRDGKDFGAGVIGGSLRFFVYLGVFVNLLLSCVWVPDSETLYLTANTCRMGFIGGKNLLVREGECEC